MYTLGTYTHPFRANKVQSVPFQHPSDSFCTMFSECTDTWSQFCPTLMRECVIIGILKRDPDPCYCMFVLLLSSLQSHTVSVYCNSCSVVINCHTLSPDTTWVFTCAHVKKYIGSPLDSLIQFYSTQINSIPYIPFQSSFTKKSQFQCYNQAILFPSCKWSTPGFVCSNIINTLWNPFSTCWKNCFHVLTLVSFQSVWLAFVCEQKEHFFHCSASFAMQWQRRRTFEDLKLKNDIKTQHRGTISLVMSLE